MYNGAPKPRVWLKAPERVHSTIMIRLYRIVRQNKHKRKKQKTPNK